MREILLSILLAVALVGSVKAQEMTGPAAEQAKQEVLKLETEKFGGQFKAGSSHEKWFESHNDPDGVVARADGGIDSRAQHLEMLRSVVQTPPISMKQYDHHISIFENGNVAMVVYKIDAQFTWEPHPVQDTAEDIWIKENGSWRRILHSVHRIMNMGGGAYGATD